MPETLGISIYAELLSNIRQVSVAVSLSSDVNSTTKSEIISGGQCIRITHNSFQKELSLPGRVAAPSVLPIQNKNPRTLTWRLPLSPALSPRSISPEEQSVPWPALDIEVGCPISCRTCKQVLVQSGTIHAWKDLPSDNWAEMMEFWHCHKPSVHGHRDDEALARRGYGANSAIVARSSVGFVDLTSFLFDESDVQGIKYAGHHEQRDTGDNPESQRGLPPSPVHCANCGQQLGRFQSQRSAISLFKWQVDCTLRSPAKLPTSSDCLAASLLSSLSRSGSSKSVLMPIGSALVDQSTRSNFVLEGTLVGSLSLSAKDTMYVWILNPHVTYASSQQSGVRSALKLLYRLISHDEADGLLEPVASSVQEIPVEADALTTAQHSLEEASALLPPEERLYKEWLVSLLNVYEKSSPIE